MPSAAVNPAERAKIAHELRQSISELKDRGLLVAAKWFVLSTSSVEIKN
jgi:hypothetical protein